MIQDSKFYKVKYNLQIFPPPFLTSVFFTSFSLEMNQVEIQAEIQALIAQQLGPLQQQLQQHQQQLQQQQQQLNAVANATAGMFLLK